MMDKREIIEQIRQKSDTDVDYTQFERKAVFRKKCFFKDGVTCPYGERSGNFQRPFCPCR